MVLQPWLPWGLVASSDLPGNGHVRPFCSWILGSGENGRVHVLPWKPMSILLLSFCVSPILKDWEVYLFVCLVHSKRGEENVEQKVLYCLCLFSELEASETRNGFSDSPGLCYGFPPGRQVCSTSTCLDIRRTAGRGNSSNQWYIGQYFKTSACRPTAFIKLLRVFIECEVGHFQWISLFMK